MISIFETIFAILFFIICLTTFILSLKVDKISIMMVEFEYWALWLELGYYLLLALMLIIGLINKSTENNFVQLLKNTIFKWFWPIVMYSGTVYYLGYFFRWFVLYFNKTGVDFCFNLLLHGISQSCFLIDIIFFSRKPIETYTLDFLIISGAFAVFSFFCFTWRLNSEIYLFLQEKDDWYVISTLAFCYLILLFMYSIYHSIVKVRYGLHRLIEPKKETSTTQNIDNTGELIPQQEMK